MDSTVILLDAIRKRKSQLKAEASLIEFTQQAWPIIEPGTPFKDNWHLHAIAEHLEAITAGELENLIINIPPGCMKSILVSVAWPAWEWLQNPTLRYLGASYGADLAIRDARKCRDIIMSEWYQANWPRVAIKPGEDQKTKYELTAGGWRMATSVGGRATGEHPDRKIVDDPHNAKQAESEAERETALTWFDRTLSTRGESRNAKTVVVMQRLHEQDITGHILADKHNNYEHLCLPMEYAGGKKKTSIGWADPRTKDGSLLWPTMFPEVSVARLKRNLGTYGASGQLQQNPTPEGGGIIKVKHFQKWPTTEKFPAFRFMATSYDTAFTEKTQGDPTGAITAGVFDYKGRDCLMILDCWTEHLGYPALRKRALDDWQERFGVRDEQKGRKADVMLIEAKGSGMSLIQDMQMSNVPVRSYNPGNADKISRAHQVAPIIELDCIYIPESKKRPGEFVTWSNGFVDQVGKFPKADHDEYVDCLTQLIIMLRNMGYFDLQVVEQEEPEELEYMRRKQNPYSV